jgi:hypothetical protein
MNDLTSIGRWIILGGLALLTLGGVIWIAGKLNLPLGRLPGDIRIEGEGFSCIAPLATSLLLSIILTVLLNLILRRMR